MAKPEQTVEALELQRNLEKRFDDVIEHAQQAGGTWQEDIISREIVAELALLSDITFTDRHSVYRSLSVLPYQHKGSAEKRFGDIAIVMEIRTGGGAKVQGVRYFEAKNRGSDDKRASALCDTQGEAKAAAKRMYPNIKPDVERQRNTKRGQPDQWRP